MDDATLPEWIRKIKQEQDRSAHKRETEERSRQLLGATLQAQGNQGWSSLIQELRSTLASLAAIGVQGEITPLSDEPDGFRVKLWESSSAHPRSTRTDVVWNAENRVYINCRPSDGPEYRIEFRLGAHGGYLALFSNGITLTDESATQIILRPMVEWLKG
jgi:hypothetical protein